MRVPYSYLADQFGDPEPILEAVRTTLLKHHQYTFGPELEEFEARMARYTGARYCLGTASGTAALSMLLKAAGVGPGDEVVTVSQTFIATIGSIAAVGARPFYVDVLDDFTMDPSLLEEAITERTKAVMPVWYSGAPPRMEEIMAVAERRSLPVIEDSCCAISAKIGGKHAGTFGIGGAFSVHPLKNLNVWGDGGFIVTDSEEIYNKVLLLRNHGLKERDEVEVYGYNARLDTIQAIVGNYLYPQIDEITDRRIANAKFFDEAFSAPPLSEFITVPPRREGARHVYHMYMVLASDRDRLLQHLIDAGVEAKVHYPIPNHLQKASLEQDPSFGRTALSRTESQCRSLISLPVHQHLSRRQLEYVVETVKGFFARI